MRPWHRFTCTRNHGSVACRATGGAAYLRSTSALSNLLAPRLTNARTVHEARRCLTAC